MSTDKEVVTPQSFFEEKLPKLLDDPRGEAVLKKIDKTYCFEITGDGGGVWTVELKPHGRIFRGKAGKVASTLSCSMSSAERLFNDPGCAMSLYQEGLLKVDGLWGALSLKALKELKI